MIFVVLLVVVFIVPFSLLVGICTVFALRTFSYLMAIAFGVSFLSIFPSGRKELKRLI